jgi:hypothetical protein
MSVDTAMSKALAELRGMNNRLDRAGRRKRKSAGGGDSIVTKLNDLAQEMYDLIDSLPPDEEDDNRPGLVVRNMADQLTSMARELQQVLDAPVREDETEDESVKRLQRERRAMLRYPMVTKSARRHPGGHGDKPGSRIFARIKELGYYENDPSTWPTRH